MEQQIRLTVIRTDTVTRASCSSVWQAGFIQKCVCVNGHAQKNAVTGNAPASVVDMSHRRSTVLLEMCTVVHVYNVSIEYLRGGGGAWDLPPRILMS